MAIYEVPANRSYEKWFRVAACGVILAMLGVLLFSIYQPESVGDSVNHAVGIFAISSLVAAMVGAEVLGAKLGSWKSLQKLRFEVSEGKIIRTDEASSAVEIQLDQIDYLRDYHGWLVVSGGNPRQNIAIPEEVNGFDELKRELALHCPVPVYKAKFSPLSFLPLIAILACWVAIFTSHIRTVVVAAGFAALAFQMVWTDSLWRGTRATGLPRYVVPLYIYFLLTLAWLVYKQIERAV
jgi:hypothetical protein